METIKAKLKEYLAMDEELGFGEFNDYYNSIMAELNDHYQSYDENTLLEMKYVLSTVAVNAQAWASRKDKNAKKYRKIEEKSRFWADAISYKLKHDLGYTTETLNEADERIDAEMRPQEN